MYGQTLSSQVGDVSFARVKRHLDTWFIHFVHGWTNLVCPFNNVDLTSMRQQTDAMQYFNLYYHNAPTSH